MTQLNHLGRVGKYVSRDALRIIISTSRTDLGRRCSVKVICDLRAVHTVEGNTSGYSTAVDISGDPLVGVAAVGSCALHFRIRSGVKMVYNSDIVHAIERNGVRRLGGKDICGNALLVVSKFADGVLHLMGVCCIKVIEIGWLVRSLKGYCVKDRGWMGWVCMDWMRWVCMDWMRWVYINVIHIGLLVCYLNLVFI